VPQEKAKRQASRLSDSDALGNDNRAAFCPEAARGGIFRDECALPIFAKVDSIQAAIDLERLA